MSRRRAVLLGGALLVLAAGASALITAEVVARGKLVPSGGPGVRRVRVWDSLEFYISSETARPALDVLTTIVFAAVAASLGFGALVLVLGGARGHLLAFLAIASAGAAFLAADELLAIHESVGHNLQFLRRIPGVERPDDIVLMAYAVPLGLFAWYFRDILLSARAPRWLLAAAVACAVLSSLVDLMGTGGVEERAELVTALLAATGLIWLAAIRVAGALTVEEEAGPARTGLQAQPSSRPSPATASSSPERAL